MDEQYFWDAITAAPDDLSIRGIFADWLDEHNRHVEAEIMRKLADGEYAPWGQRYPHRKSWWNHGRIETVNMVPETRCGEIDESLYRLLRGLHAAGFTACYYKNTADAERDLMRAWLQWQTGDQPHLTPTRTTREDWETHE